MSIIVINNNDKKKKKKKNDKCNWVTELERIIQSRSFAFFICRKYEQVNKLTGKCTYTSRLHLPQKNSVRPPVR